MKNPAYSERQLKIITGEISLDSVNGRTALALYNKAIANGDMALAQSAKERIAKAKDEARVRNIERTRLRNDSVKEGRFEWKQPKYDEYTDHQKMIVRGEIPLSEVHTKELIHIHLKAKANGDYELSERLFDLISSRRAEAQEKQFKKFEKFKTEGYTPQNPDALTKWDQGVIDGIIDLSDCPLEKLQHIYEIAVKEDDEAVIARVRFLMQIKEHPESLYVVDNQNAAVDLIESLLQMPIRRPNTWFEEN